MELTKKERLILINQYEIRKALDKENADYYEECITILQNGYSLFYDRIFGDIIDEMPEEDVRFVLDVLDICNAIQIYKIDHPKDAEVAKHPWSTFAGFDDNTEATLNAFAEFLVKDQGKFRELAPFVDKAGGLNSHMPTREIYSRMLSMWHAQGGYRQRRSHDEVMALLNATELPARSDG